mmetsp:Transcript_19039/g.62871  ORF Transcript_19039/g.62871 Transcript_19039/m.62871 type:complete len:271 (-) Transcript_19039:384-1196(-)
MLTCQTRWSRRRLGRRRSEMESRVDDAMRQPRTSVAPLAVGAERPSGRLLLNLEGHAPHEFLRDVGVCARNLVDQLVDGSKGAVVSEHERVVGLQVLARGLGANLLAVEEADRDAVLVRHVGRGVDVGAGVANHDECRAPRVLPEEGGGGAVSRVLGEGRDRGARSDRLRRRVGSIVEAVGANGDVLGKRVVLAQKLLDHVGEAGGDDEQRHLEHSEPREQLERARPRLHPRLADHARDEVARRLAVLDHQLVRLVPPRDPVHVGVGCPV